MHSAELLVEGAAWVERLSKNQGHHFCIVHGFVNSDLLEVFCARWEVRVEFPWNARKIRALHSIQSEGLHFHVHCRRVIDEILHFVLCDGERV